MIGDLLLWLMVADLREFDDNELQEFLEAMLGLAEQDDHPVAAELREAILQQLEAPCVVRDTVSAWPDDFPELLPESLARYTEALELFEDHLDRTDSEPSPRMVQFQSAQGLLASPHWQSRSEAARVLATMEEDIFAATESYNLQPLTKLDCSPMSVVAHRYLREGIDTWQEAFRLVHRGRLEEALTCAEEAEHILRALTTWEESLSESAVT